MKRQLRKLSAIMFSIFVVTLIASVLTFVIFDRSVAFQLEAYAKQIAANRMNLEVNKAVLNEIRNSEITYDSLVTIDKSTDGKITAVRADMMEVNVLKNKLEISVAEMCSQNEYYISEIPIGNIVGNGMFYGKGFDIGIKFRPLGDAMTNMSGTFHEAGINQTIYRISFDVLLEVAIVFPFRYIEIPVKVETVIAETIIVGDVPDSFTHFDLNGDITSQDFQGYVEDYMAE